MCRIPVFMSVQRCCAKMVPYLPDAILKILLTDRQTVRSVPRFFKAVSEGYREFQAIAIISDSEEVTSPCGVCRQVMAEFCGPEFEVTMVSCKGDYQDSYIRRTAAYAFSMKK